MEKILGEGRLRFRGRDKSRLGGTPCSKKPAVSYLLVSGFECTFSLFRTRRYKVVSPSTYATRIRTYGQPSNVACFDQHSDEKPKVEIKTKSNCTPDGSVMSANSFRSRIVIITCWYSTGIYLNYILCATTFISSFTLFAMM